MCGSTCLQSECVPDKSEHEFEVSVRHIVNSEPAQAKQ